jgi:hypothetical protein
MFPKSTKQTIPVEAWLPPRGEFFAAWDATAFSRLAGSLTPDARVAILQRSDEVCRRRSPACRAWPPKGLGSGSRSEDARAFA